MIDVNGGPMDWKDGLTVRDVIVAKHMRSPMLIVSINDTRVEPRDFDLTPVPDGAYVQMIHLLSGG
jgi:sulfur carrier protein